MEPAVQIHGVPAELVHAEDTQQDHWNWTSQNLTTNNGFEGGLGDIVDVSNIGERGEFWEAKWGDADENKDIIVSRGQRNQWDHR